jgi:hypothetical protein
MDTYDPHILSFIAQNSLYNTGLSDAKPNRISGERMSYEEIETGMTRAGTLSRDRIIVDFNDTGSVVLLDGRHLLEAYRSLNRIIPSSLVLFSHREARKIYEKHLFQRKSSVS